MTRLRSLLIAAALALPVIGVVLLAAAKQMAITSATTLRVPIIGYDPRNLMYGHYLRFRFDGPKAPDQDSHDYFIPEAQAGPLQDLLTHQNGHIVAIEIRTQGDGRQSYGMLYVDDLPWHDYLDAHPNATQSAK